MSDRRRYGVQIYYDICGRMPNNRGHPQKSDDKRAMPQGMRKRNIIRQPEHSQNNSSVEDSTPAVKMEQTVVGKIDRKVIPKAATCEKNRSGVKREPPVERLSEPKADPPLSSTQQARRGSIGNRPVMGLVNSYASVAKGVTSSQESQQPRGYYQNDRQKRRSDHEPEDKDIVKVLMKLYRIRFRDFRKYEETHYIHHEPMNHHGPKGRLEIPLSVQDVPGVYQPRMHSASHEIRRPLMHENSNEMVKMPPVRRTSAENLTPVGRRSDDFVLSDPISHMARHRRHDGGRPQYTDRRRRNYNDRFSPHEEDRGYVNYGRYRNRVNGHGAHKAEFKRDDRIERV
ncbi:uncharacterized protein BXIN_2935 [Babesia sp. Xinjiang]|uniref:uncharacterized protein n=1 Tax=Babesia sp. Xinjiang TaxID=462227 RepID=UPI000A23848B|nr:uncharacterized protein BXIN_2935 [Babesia sp. Xinjiang]ORM39511.1 hypothetical protein BXIN_2935 [Babesia sp. Xinjiang]